MKKLLKPILLSILMIGLSCSNEDESIESQNFNFEKTTIQTNAKNTIVTTSNESTDFDSSNILLTNGIKVEKGKIINNTDLNLWYVPFDVNSEPILIQSKVAPCGDPVLSCECPGGTVAQQASCGFESTDNGDGTCSTTCEGVTCCKMKVTGECIDGKNQSSISGFLNGVIVATETIIFNNVKYPIR